ncbi:hypothetical protein KN199_12620, partial [Staphylococcus succinus]|nr:hypothetical protein [Staphylococcus succinus]
MKNYISHKLIVSSFAFALSATLVSKPTHAAGEQLDNQLQNNSRTNSEINDNQETSKILNDDTNQDMQQKVNSSGINHPRLVEDPDQVVSAVSGSDKMKNITDTSQSNDTNQDNSDGTE